MNKADMSTRVPYPLDDRFRGALEGAKVTPLPEVWEGIVRARAGHGGSRKGWTLMLVHRHAAYADGLLPLDLGLLAPGQYTIRCVQEGWLRVARALRE